MNEDLHADFVSHFTEFLVKYGQLLECCEKCHMDIAGQYLINPTEETKTPVSYTHLTLPTKRIV